MRSGQLVADRYRLEELIGSGGMGVVWRAVDTELGRVVAVKHASPGQGRRGAEWLRREAKNAARVHHPNAVTLFDAVREDADCWLVMEYVPAESLATTLDRNGPLDPRSAARIAAQIAAALAAMHASGIVHRDVKPGNVLVTEHGLAKLTDFGISRWTEETLTHTGPEPGTPAYRAPEVASGRPATSASDVYSLGATLFAIVEGKPPHGGELVSGTPLVEVPMTGRVASLGAVLGELVALDPARRPTAAAALTMLGAFADGTAVPMSDPAPASREPPAPVPIVIDPAPAGRTGAAVVPRQLPAAPRLFVGRRDELDRLDATLHDASDTAAVVVISAIAGAGGIGKTWLALHWAHQHADQFPDGQLYVNLRGFDPTGQPMSSAVAVRGFLDGLGVDPAAIPADPDAQVGLYRSLVAGRRMLIMVDNAADTTQVVPLLPGSSSSTVLVTSRRHLTGLVTTHGAGLLDLEVLPDGDARDLLARHLGPDRLAAEPEAVDEILGYCAGLPLAISIVAARVATHPDLPLAALAEELRDRTARLDALDAGELAANLRAVFACSHHALDSTTAAVFGLLGLALGPDINLSAAASLTALSAKEVRTVLQTLESAHLAQQHLPGRYRMHDLVRLYATDTAERDLAEEVREAALRRLVDHYLHTAFASDQLLEPLRPAIALDPPVPGSHPDRLADSTTALAWFETEHPHLLASQQAAVERGWHTVVWQLAWTLNTFHFRRGHRHDEMAVWQAGMAAAAHLPDPTARIAAHKYLGYACSTLARHEEATEHFQQGLALAEQTEDLLGQAHAHHALAAAWARSGEDRQALEHSTRALRLYQALDMDSQEARALNAVGWFSAHLGLYDQARSHCQAALELCRRHHDREGEAHTLDSLGFLAHRTGQHTEAVGHYQQALTLLRDVGNTYQEPGTLDKLGHSHAALGQHDQARAVWQQALELYHDQGRHDDADRVQRQRDALDHPDTTSDSTGIS
ncbi:protein kinase domain-containing protein [Saccharopolyspora soli]|uniref:protein kinase domain-containing protein n=1 Tax=Saccharopolyspora soli TaxID=2926618 RepID=UPI0027DEB92E|nr:protein kinase [Saccharopolyspora soli]